MLSSVEHEKSFITLGPLVWCFSSLFANVPYSPPMNTDNDYYPIFLDFDLLLVMRC